MARLQTSASVAVGRERRQAVAAFAACRVVPAAFPAPTIPERPQRRRASSGPDGVFHENLVGILEQPAGKVLVGDRRGHQQRKRRGVAMICGAIAPRRHGPTDSAPLRSPGTSAGTRQFRLPEASGTTKGPALSSTNRATAATAKAGSWDCDKFASSSRSLSPQRLKNGGRFPGHLLAGGRSWIAAVSLWRGRCPDFGPLRRREKYSRGRRIAILALLIWLSAETSP